MGWGNIKLFVILVVSSMGSWSLAGSSAVAQNGEVYPVYYRVNNVPSTDVLNVRADSDSGAPILGSFAYNAGPIEVLRQEHNWGYVAMGGEMGWVSMKYLRQIDLPKVGNSPLPVGLSCGGTEPFWGFELHENQVNFSHMDEGDLTFNISDSGGFSGVAGQNGFVQASGTSSFFTAIINTQQCSDGMSDLDYGWKVDLVMNGQNGAVGYSGCCRMAGSQ